MLLTAHDSKARCVELAISHLDRHHTCLGSYFIFSMCPMAFSVLGMSLCFTAS